MEDIIYSLLYIVTSEDRGVVFESGIKYVGLLYE